MTERSIYAWFSLAVLVAACGPLRPQSGTEPPAGLAPAVGPLVEAGARVARASPEISKIWAGFWQAPHAFGIAKPREAVLVVSEVAPESPFAALPRNALPPALRGRAYVAHGVIQGLYATQGNYFDLHARIVPGTELTVVFMKADPEATVEFLVHEAFHAFQLRVFSTPRRDDDAFDMPSAARPEFTSLIDLERSLLASGLEPMGRDSLEQVVRSYLAVRQRRYASTAESVRGEELHLERIEGSAHFVGLTAGAMSADPRRPGSVEKTVLEHLTMEMEAPDARWAVRMRSYGTGAAIAILLGRLNVVDWKTRLQDGATFHELLAGAVPLRPGEAEALARHQIEEAGRD